MELCVRKKTQERLKKSACQLISNMICINYDHYKKFGLFKFHSGHGKFNLNSPKGYSLKIINVQTATQLCVFPGAAGCQGAGKEEADKLPGLAVGGPKQTTGRLAEVRNKRQVGLTARW